METGSRTRKHLGYWNSAMIDTIKASLQRMHDLLGALASITDKTQRALIEAELARLNADMLIAVNAITIDPPPSVEQAVAVKVIESVEG